MDMAAHPVERPFQVTHRRVLGIALPMTLAYLSTPLLGLTDLAVIGRLGDPALLGGITVGGIIFSLVFSAFNFLKIGTTGLTAQALGAGDDVEQRAVLMRASAIAIALGFALVLLQVPILFLSMLAVGASSAVEAATTDYYTVRILAAPLTLLNYALLGWFLGLGRAGMGLLLQTVLNGVNIALSILFVLGLGWGIAGAAWATVIAEGIAALAGLAVAGRQLGFRIGAPLQVLMARDQLLRLFAMNRDILIRTFCLIAAFWMFTRAGAQQGDVILAANGVLFNMFFLGSYFLDGLATAAEQLTGRAKGARHRLAFEQAVKLPILWGFVLSGTVSAILLLAGGLMIDVISASEEVRATARVFLIWAALSPLAGVLAFQFDGVFIGATWSQDMRNMMVLSLGLFVLTWQVAEPLIGNHGVWLALHVFLGARGLTLWWRYRVRIEEDFPKHSAGSALLR
ncbi:MAG: MATE family efflux transporter [Pseudomonadota bacterium]